MTTSIPTDLNLAEIMLTVRQIAMGAGAILRQGYHGTIEETSKASSVDMVTQFDKLGEEFIVGQIRQHFPDHHIVGEEGGGYGPSIDEAKYAWYIDPIDGTTNFAHRFPHFCTSIALTNADAEPILGVLYQPISDELFTAIVGQGAFLNDQRIYVSNRKSLGEAVVGSGFGYDKWTTDDDNTKQWSTMVKKVRGIRRVGSAALDCAYIACGRLDGYWERSLNRWDIMAGFLLVQEAGGRVTDYWGGDKPQFHPEMKYIFSNGHIHDEMVQVISDSYTE